MIGYCATASNGIEIAPARQMNSATTQAKIGLSMKKLGMALPVDRAGLLRGGVDGCICLCPSPMFDPVAEREFLETFSHDLIASFQPLSYEPLAVLRASYADGVQHDTI